MSIDSTHGYDISVGYSYGFCREMAPNWLDFAARLAGYPAPARGPKGSLRFLELGCGQGVGLCLLAAANPQGSFVGVDFLPDHVAHARALAQSTGLTNIRFENADFIDLAARWPDDFGLFDYVAMHGVYTWVSAPVRAAIVACLRHATRPGALIYNGYNSQPGWLGSMPFQHVARRMKAVSGDPGAAVLRRTIELFDTLRAGGTATFDFLPGLKARLDSVKGRNPDYLVHEYLHDGWKPEWPSTVAADFAEAEVRFLGPARLDETLLPGALPPALRDSVLAQADPGLRQDVQAFIVNQGFRAEVCAREPLAASARDRAVIGDTPIHLLQEPASDADLTVKAVFGDITLQPAAFGDIVRTLRDGPRTISEPSEKVAGGAFDQLLQIVVMLLHGRVIGLGVGGSYAEAAAFNGALARKAGEGLPYNHLAAPALGSAVHADTPDMLLLDAWLAGARDRAALDAALAALIGSLGGVSDQDGKAIGKGEMHEYRSTLVQTFLDRTLPRWRALGVVDSGT